jgi:antitoxin component HigA of HigAB toxin-antitoxin module
MTMEPNPPIRIEAEYESALAEVRQLWGVEGDTPDGDDRLDLLLVLVSAYEDGRGLGDTNDPGSTRQ